MNPELKTKIKSFPAFCGVYLMKDKKGKILYIGKANHLRSRVLSYFRKSLDTRFQIQYLMSKVCDIDYILTDTEKEALLLEDVLVKKNKPKYNIFLRDDKTYVSLALSLKHPFPRLFVTRKIVKDGTLYFGPYSSAGSSREVVHFIETHFRLRTCSDHEFSNRSRPCLQYQIKKCDAPCVGYIDQKSYHKFVFQVKMFLEGKNSELKKMVKEEMGQAASQERFEQAARFRDLLFAIDATLEKQKMISYESFSRDVIGFFRQAEEIVFCVMAIRDGKLSDSKLFFLKSYWEDEAILGRFLLQYFSEGRNVPPEILIQNNIREKGCIEEILAQRSGHKIKITTAKRGDKYSFIKLAQKNAKEAFLREKEKASGYYEILERLKKVLKLKNIPLCIECYDISNFQGKEAVGSMVTFESGIPQKSKYRRFRIKSIDSPNDFAMLYEVLQRRFKCHFDNTESWKLPHLIILDGGLGQLQVGRKVFQEQGIEHIDLIALAKSHLEKNQKGKLSAIEKKVRVEERIFLPQRRNPVFLKSHDKVLHLLQNIRDEAHRFGIEYHRKIRSKRMTKSVLDDVPGVGPARKKRLFQVFGTLSKLKKASLQDLIERGKIPQTLAERIKTIL